MILIIDNYDSFVYNLAQYVGELGHEPLVHRNNRITLEEIEHLAPSHIIISPGPGTPLDGGVSNDVIRRFAGSIPILGVCLGHQCIGYVYGATVGRHPPTHGKASVIHHDGKTIFAGIPTPIEGCRYHSLVVEAETVPPCLEISAWTMDGTVMGVRHRQYVVEGVQFHPESVLTATGHKILDNFLRQSQAVWAEQHAG
ncbi:MAG: anthranilate/aminodeoxychorismate synthase component II [Chloroflexi bacterium]|nr:MAG: anthranilate/aminodeoxychorismate synthase component II [Chloroflexota bacterium]